MLELAENNGKIFVAITIDDPSDFVPPFCGTLFPCLIWDHEGCFTEAQRAVIARKLLDAGCRYAVCGGENCEAWHLTVDMEFVRRHLNDPEEVQDAALVMTSSHLCESPDDIAFFFVLNTDFDYHHFSRYLVLHVGDGSSRGEINAAVRRYALNKETG